MPKRKYGEQYGVEAHLIIIFGFANQLASEFYENTLGFTETLSYVFLINSINANAYKILKNPKLAAAFCSDMNADLITAELELTRHFSISQLIRDLSQQNTIFINKNKETE